MTELGSNSNGAVRYWLKIASVVLAAWAAMIPVGIMIIERSFNDYNDALKANTALQADVQRRLAILETAQLDVMRRLHELDEHVGYDDRQISELQRRDGMRR